MTLRGTRPENVVDFGAKEAIPIASRLMVDGPERFGTGHSFRGTQEWRGRTPRPLARACYHISSPPAHLSGTVKEHAKGGVASKRENALLGVALETDEEMTVREGGMDTGTEVLN